MERILGRYIEDKVRPFIRRDEIIIIRGPRQAGKSTLLKLLAAGIKYGKVFVDLDISSNRAAMAESPIDYVKGTKTSRKLALFLDEVQRLDNAGEITKIIYDTYKGQVKIFASGSSSLEIKNKVLGYLVGRAVLFELYTFGFGEFLRAKSPEMERLFKEKNNSLVKFITAGGKVARPSWSDRLLGMWKEYAVFGGYPEVVKAASMEVKRKLLSDLINLYIEKDVVSFFKIENTREFGGFVKALAFNTSQLLTLSNVSKDSGLTYYNANSLMGVLENTYIAQRVYPYHKNITSSIRKAPKLFFLDLGLRNAVINNLMAFDDREDRGKLAENFVFRELLSLGYKPMYWRTKSGAEMDFVLETDGDIVPIEVKLGGSRALGRSFYSFIGAYKPKRAVVVTLDEFSIREVNGTTVLTVPIFYL